MLNSLGINKSPSQTKVCVAMSGGVDSTAAACMLLQEGYQVFGLTMDLLQAPYAPQNSSIKDAVVVAKMLGIEHHYIDYKDIFFNKVVQPFISTYLNGETPSPCILCNKYIKLGALCNKARELGADVIVTGHYAQTIMGAKGIELHRAKDLTKDQSYFLFAVDYQNLQMLRCPLANYSKEETRKIVQEANLPIFQKPDSQDICFVSEGKYATLINHYHPNQSTPGKIIHIDGRELGEHQGLIHYTVGQRKGLKIGGNNGVLYVLKLDVENNRLIVGPRERLHQSRVLLRDVNWLIDDIPTIGEFDVKLRSRQDCVPAAVRPLPNNQAEVILINDSSGVAPGQGCCFYQKNKVVGGGFICKK